MVASRVAAQLRALSSDRRVVRQGCLAAAATAVLFASGEALRRRPPSDEESKEDTSRRPRLAAHANHLALPPNKSLMEAAFPSLSARLSSVRRHATIQKLNQTKNTSATLESRYKVHWKRPLGEGTFGAVYSASRRATGEAVAVKKISKQFTDNLAFQREMEALLHIRENGGHPYICGLQENYDEGDFYYLVLDLVSGGEMFDHLCQQGAYSEADAARLVREVASALAFMHGIDIVHGDMKPENLMLSTTQSASSVIKVVDFGCAQVDRPGGGLARRDSHKPRMGTANTPAYSPPEVLNRFKGKDHIEPSFDMWALGVIIYIMLTGVHPFDLYGNSSDEEIEEQILSGKQPPLGKSPLTAHLSEDAIHLIKKLLMWDPRKRLTAQQLLNHPWVRGETARTSKIADSDKRLSAYRAFKTKLEARVFADMVAMSDNLDGDEVMKKTSLIERSFYMLNPDHRGYVTTKTLRKLTKEQMDDGSVDATQPLSLSGFSDILAENMKNRYFPKGHVLYHEGDIGDAMYFINSGTVEVYTRDGLTKTLRKAGESFGEGALLHPKKIRSASIRTVTPVHAIEISREYFEKYLATEEGAKLNLREKDKQRKRQRAKTILQLQQNLKEVDFKRGDYVWRKGDEGKHLYIIEEGRIGVNVDDVVVFTLRPGELCGEHSLLFGRQNVNAVCVSEHCKLQAMSAGDFYKLLESHPSLKESIRDICLRRVFQKALCARIKKPFPKKIADLREAFDIVDNSKSGAIELRELRTIIKRFDPNFTEQNIREVLQSLDLAESGKVSWAEFKKMFDLGSSA